MNDRRERLRDVPVACRLRLCKPAPDKLICPNCKRVIYRTDKTFEKPKAIDL